MANNINDIIKTKYLAVIRDLPQVIANEAENISLDAFKTSSWGGVPWPARNPKAKRNDRRALLVDSGALRDGIYALPQNPKLIYWGNDIRYARIHNYGGIIQQAARSETFLRNRSVKLKRFKKGVVKGVKGFTFKERTIVMPQRQFMGDAPFVRNRLVLAAKTYLLKQLNH